MENKKKVVNVDWIYVSVVLVERVWRQTALSNGLKNKWILGQQKTIITSLSLSLWYISYFTATCESRIKHNKTGTFPQAKWIQFL